MPAAMPEKGTYFVFGFPLSHEAWRRYALREVLPDEVPADPDLLSLEIRSFADRINQSNLRRNRQESPVPAEVLLALRTLNQALRHVAGNYFAVENPGCLARSRAWSETRLGAANTAQLLHTFCELFPPLKVALAEVEASRFVAEEADRTVLEMLLLFVNVTNPATAPAAELFDDSELRQRSSFSAFVTGLAQYLDRDETPGSEGRTIVQLLQAPALACPGSLSGQLAWIRDNWAHLLPPEMLRRLVFALDVLKEIDLARKAEYGPPPVLKFGPGSPGWSAAAPEPEAFSRDADWMANVVLMAKSVYVWLDQISRATGREIHRLDEIPDHELDRLAAWGVNGLWLIGLWQRADASRLIKQRMGNAEAAASAYALYDYRIADDLGGEDAWRNLSERAGRRGLRLASDMVPNHMGLDSRWVVEHPDFFLQAEHPPYPAYRFTSENLSADPRVSIRIEDGYYSHADAAVVFQRVDNHTGQVRYIYHGNDGTSMPWNDTAQLNFLLPEVREAVTQVILQVARRFPIIRFDAAMTLAKKHYQRLWFPAPGDAGAIPSRAEYGLDKPAFDQVFPTEFWRDVVDRVAAEVPDTLLLAEAFWLMEGYFVRTLGMHRVYNSAFMNMLKMEDNQKYRQTLKNVLEFSPAILQRFVNFMNNPDERTAVEQFGKGDKYFGCCLLLVTMPGLPMLGHGQIEGFSEKYGMEYRQAYWDEPVDTDLVARHEREIFPLMRRRHLFSGSENFALYDFVTEGGWVDENVFAYSNRAGGEKALIIFNNCFEPTRGRVNQSAAVNRGSAEQPHLVRRSLGEALDLDAAPGVWYIFVDRSCGLEFLRRGAELAYEGFRTELNGYESRALVDFQRVHESEGRWAELAERLHGGGVQSVRLELRCLELAAELATVRSWAADEILSELETSLAGTVDAAEVDAEVDAEAGATSAAATAVPVTAERPPLPLELHSAVDDISRLGTMKPSAALGRRSAADLTSLLEALPGSRLPQAMYLREVFRLLPGPWSAAGAEPTEIQVRLAALREPDLPLVRRELRAALAAWTGHEYAGHSTVDLAELVLRSEVHLDAMAAGRAAWFPAVLDLPGAWTVLGVSRHEGRTYVNRESLTDYLQAMVCAGLLAEPKLIGGLLDAQALLLETAARSGYDVDSLRRSLAD